MNYTFSEKKRCCSVSINANNNITMKPVTEKYSIEISVESINNNGIAKSNAREERAIATSTLKLIKTCDIRNNNVVDHTKNDVRKVNGNQLYHNLLKNTKQRTISQFNACTNNASNNGDTQQKQKRVSRTPRKSAFIVGDSMIKKYRWLYTYQFYLS